MTSIKCNSISLNLCISSCPSNVKKYNDLNFLTCSCFLLKKAIPKPPPPPKKINIYMCSSVGSTPAPFKKVSGKLSNLMYIPFHGWMLPFSTTTWGVVVNDHPLVSPNALEEMMDTAPWFRQLWGAKVCLGCNATRSPVRWVVQKWSPHVVSCRYIIEDVYIYMKHLECRVFPFWSQWLGA